ncbi:Uncharacterized protein APZ42_015917 [Daphnia magna]|uniref:Uncharacterized protein n=1 Tax=Daphnia magna TaxID=35525 RepID=A0A162NFT2_9CRUS|nr:Uncharacterized protein APZ42_015917 [Daphnia magna]
MCSHFGKFSFFVSWLGDLALLTIYFESLTATIPRRSDNATGIHLQSTVQRVTGEKVRGRRRMLLDVRRMRSLSDPESG